MVNEGTSEGVVVGLTVIEALEAQRLVDAIETAALRWGNSSAEGESLSAGDLGDGLDAARQAFADWLNAHTVGRSSAGVGQG